MLWKMPSLGLRLQQPLAFQLWLSQVCLSAPGVGRGKGPVCSQLALLWYSLNLVFCELESFIETFSFLFFSSLVIPQFGLLSHVSSLRLSSGPSGPVPPLCMQPSSPCSAPTHCWWTQATGPPLRWESRLGTESVGSFFLPVMLPSEIPKLPTDPPVRGFPGVWKLLLLHDSLPRTDHCP